MIIKEGSLITIIDGNMPCSPIVDEIIANEDIKIENETGNGYTFLLRNTGSKDNSIFEADKITKTEKGFVVEGYFKDAILIIEDKKEKSMHESYMNYDN